MKIFFISPSFYPAIYYGGPIFSLYNLTRCLAKNSQQVFISTTNANGKNRLNVKTNKYLKLENNLSVKYYNAGTQSGFSFRMLLSLWNDINGKDILYLVSIFSPPTPMVIFLNLFFGKPLILSTRGQLGEWCLKHGSILKKIWLKVFIAPFADKIWWEATSFSEKEMILKVYPNAKVEVIPPIVEVEEYTSRKVKVESETKNISIYEKLTARNPDGKRILVSMGRLHKVKGLDILINAVAQVLNEIKEKGIIEDIVLLIAGEDFGERRNLELLIDKLSLRENVFLVGMLNDEDKKEFLRNADLFALASHHENFGIVYAEALASGIPVIASKHTPWKDVEKFDCGKWIDNTPENFAESIVEILNADTVQLGLNGKNYIKENFSCEKISVRYKKLFSDLIV